MATTFSDIDANIAENINETIKLKLMVTHSSGVATINTIKEQVKAANNSGLINNESFNIINIILVSTEKHLEDFCRDIILEEYNKLVNE